MADFAAQLKLLVKRGCIVRAGGLLHTVAAAAIDRHRVFFSTMFPDDQHHTHTVEFARAIVVRGFDLAFYLRGREVAYFTHWSNFEQIDPDDYLTERSRWLDRMTDAQHNAVFRNFVAQEMPRGMTLLTT